MTTATQSRPAHVTILGAGPAGLAAAYYARRAGLPFTVLEASPTCGGNARTVEDGPFRFDTVHAYPVLEPGFDKVLAELSDDLTRFSNLAVSGRNGLFVYSHLHDQIRFARDIIAAYVS